MGARHGGAARVARGAAHHRQTPRAERGARPGDWGEGHSDASDEERSAGGATGPMTPRAPAAKPSPPSLVDVAWCQVCDSVRGFWEDVGGHRCVCELRAPKLVRVRYQLAVRKDGRWARPAGCVCDEKQPEEKRCTSTFIRCNERLTYDARGGSR